MRIHLHRNYRGVVTNEETLTQGVHDVDETLGQYLVENGHARVVMSDGHGDTHIIAEALATGQLDNEDDVVLGDDLIDDVVSDKAMEYHNESDIEVTVDDVQVTVDGVQATVEYELTTAKTREWYLGHYKRIYGKPAPSNITDETLRDRVENPPDDTPDTNG